MRYQFAVTGFTQERELSHLSAAEARLSDVLARPKPIAVGCIVALTALGWLALALMSVGTPFDWRALCRLTAAGGVADLALAVPMWMAMTLVMMLPTAGPMILTYAEIADTAARQREPVVSPFILTAGYVTVWLGFALAAAAAQWTLGRSGVLEGGNVGWPLGGALFLVAGVYQFSSLKQACLTQCQRPFPFFFLNWTAERTGVFRLGLRQGLFCLGCCWAMMLLMFAVGTMNVVWMAALGVAMTIEKLSSTARFSEALGVGFAAIGLGMIGLGMIAMSAM